jgi:hypothetical protein
MRHDPDKWRRVSEKAVQAFNRESTEDVALGVLSLTSKQCHCRA